MSKFLHIFIGTIFVFLFGFSCNQETDRINSDTVTSEQELLRNYTDENVTVNEFVTWCADEDHKLNKVKEIADIRYTLSYLPSETMAFLELRKEEYDFSKFKKTSENYSEMTYFNFKVEVINGRIELLKHQLQSASQYEARVKYMSFEMENDIYLLQGKDTLHPGLFHFERIFEVAPYATVMFAFDNQKFNKDENFTIVYNDKLFEKGFVKFNYKTKQLINVPNISEL